MPQSKKKKNGRQKKRLEDNINAWTVMDFVGSARTAEVGMWWRGILVKSHRKAIGKTRLQYNRAASLLLTETNQVQTTIKEVS